MEIQSTYINGKQRQSVIIRNQEYVREGYNIAIGILERFEKKCDLLGTNKSKIVADLVTAFTEVNGWGEETKSTPIFERRSGYHVKEAIGKTLRGMFPWRTSNEN